MINGKGEAFYAIKASYIEDTQTVSIVMPLNKIINKDKNSQAYYFAGCTMSCSGCEACKQTIITQCAEQTCSCTRGSGGSTSSITYN